MNRRMLIIVAIALLLISGAGLGYAVTTYTGTTYTESNMDYNETSIILTDNTGAAVTNALEFSIPTYTTPVDHGDYFETTVSASSETLSNYKLKIACPGDSLSVRCFVTLSDSRSWAIISTITVNVYANDASSSPSYSYVINPPSESETSVTLDGVAIPYKTWTEDQSSMMTLNKTDINYVSFTIAFKAVTLKYDSNVDDDLDFLNLTGMKVRFAASTSDPSSSS